MNIRYEPMLCQKGTNEILKEEDYIFEPKLDGTRCIAYISEENVKLINRRNRDISKRYPFIVKELRKINHDCILDGEIVCYNKNNVPDFNLIQKREQIDSDIMIEARAVMIPATYVIFDILEIDGKDLLSIPLIERKKILDEVIRDDKHIQKIFYTTKGEKLWNEIKKRNMEGVIAKKMNSKYYPDERRWYWIKLKNLKTIDVIIVGYISEKRKISSLGMGLYKGDDLFYIGNVGTGFTDFMIERLSKKFEELKVDEPTVINHEKAPKEMIWVKPELVGIIEYLEMTKSLELRAPAFKGLRTDKSLKECNFDQLWKERIDECIEIFNKEEEKPVILEEQKRLYEDFIIEQPTLLRGRDIPYSWIKSKIESYRRV